MEKRSTTWFGPNSVRSVLSTSFYLRPTLEVAQDLLGKVLVVRTKSQYSFDDPRSKTVVSRIVETEGYHGKDPASHASRGETPRCAPMFEKGGIAYVYFTYGMYDMLNFVTEKKGYPGAVLIRAVECLHGHEHVEKRRKGIGSKFWTNGPGRLTKALGVTRSLNRHSLRGPELYVCEDGFHPKEIFASPRVGISEAKSHLWRYTFDHPCVSPVKENKLAKQVSA